MALTTLRKLLAKLAIGYDEISPEAAHHAGTIFWKYRREGGPREHLLPDFLVAAHAQVQCGQLAAIDRGYFRRYFPRLRLLKPKARGDSYRLRLRKGGRRSYSKVGRWKGFRIRI